MSLYMWKWQIFTNAVSKNVNYDKKRGKMFEQSVDQIRIIMLYNPRVLHYIILFLVVVNGVQMEN